MKKIILYLTLVFGLFALQPAQAQVNVSINIGNQPVWGPVGYDYVEYYYFPDLDIYYNVPQGEFIYWDGFQWVYSYTLPGRYAGFDLYRSYKVVINEPYPYLHNDIYRTRYFGYRGRQQDIIYYSHDPRYYVIEKHPEHERWMQSRGRGADYDRRESGRYPGNNNRNDDQRRNDNRMQQPVRVDGQRIPGRNPVEVQNGYPANRPANNNADQRRSDEQQRSNQQQVPQRRFDPATQGNNNNNFPQRTEQPRQPNDNRVNNVPQRTEQTRQPNDNRVNNVPQRTEQTRQPNDNHVNPPQRTEQTRQPNENPVNSTPPRTEQNRQPNENRGNTGTDRSQANNYNSGNSGRSSRHGGRD